MFYLCNSEEIARTKREFFQVRRFPGVLGLVDGSHFAIQKRSENVFIFRIYM